MRPSPFEGGILIASPREIIFRPGFNAVAARGFLVAVITGNLHRIAILRAVPAHFMVDYNVAIYQDIIVMKRSYRLLQLALRAILRANRTLLIKFAQVIQVIHTVADIINPRMPLISWWQPHRRNADVLQMRCIRLKIIPVASIAR
ncbi:hypothetical protein D3C77_399720 [compost metagenome]